MAGGRNRRLAKAMEARDLARRSVCNPGGTWQLGLWFLAVLISVLFLPWMAVLPEGLPPGLVLVFEEPMYDGHLLQFVRQLQQPGRPFGGVELARVRGFSRSGHTFDAVWIPSAMGVSMEGRLQALRAVPEVRAVYTAARLTGFREALQRARRGTAAEVGGAPIAPVWWQSGRARQERPRRGDGKNQREAAGKAPAAVTLLVAHSGDREPLERPTPAASILGT